MSSLMIWSAVVLLAVLFICVMVTA